MTNDDQEIEIELYDARDLEALKMSMVQEVRDQYFQAYSNLFAEENMDVILDLCKVRMDYAKDIFGRSSYFDFQKEKNLLHIPGDLLDKVS